MANWRSRWQRIRWQTGPAGGRKEGGRLAQQVAEEKVAEWPSRWQRRRWQTGQAGGGQFLQHTKSVLTLSTGSSLSHHKELPVGSVQLLEEISVAAHYHDFLDFSSSLLF